jgi:uncharacterized protein (DUF58 family)
MSATKGAIVSLLTDAYQRRDRVGLIVFQKNRATLVLPPTNSVQLAQRALADLLIGGKTPLSAGLTLAFKVIEQEKRSHPDVMPMMILLTDGAGNVSTTDLAPQKRRRPVPRGPHPRCGDQHGACGLRPGAGAGAGRAAGRAVLHLARVEGREPADGRTSWTGRSRH